MTPKTVVTVLATLAVATSVLSAPTQDDCDRALKSLHTFSESLYDWNIGSKCFDNSMLKEQECVLKELSVLDRVVRDGACVASFVTHKRV